jgi:hypothetical protein
MAPYTDPNEVFALLRVTDDVEILEAAHQAVEERLGQLFPDAPGEPHVQTSDEYRPGVQAQPLVAPAPAGTGGTDVFEQERLAQDNYQQQAEEGRQIRQAQPVFVTNTGASEQQKGQAKQTRELLAKRDQEQAQAVNQGARPQPQGAPAAFSPPPGAAPPPAQSQAPSQGLGGPEGKGNALANPAAKPEVQKEAGKGTSSQGFQEGSDQGHALREGAGR